MLELRKFVAPEFIFGPDALQLVGRYLHNFGARKVLIVTDPGLIEAGLTDTLVKLIVEDGVQFSIFSEISANPRDSEVMAGVEQYLREQCDIIVAIGGGSPMDCAKGIGIVATNGHHIAFFEGIDNVPEPGPPLICIPTTSGSSADVSQFAIISVPSRMTKIAIISKTMVPDVALIDPVVTLSMSPHLTACTGLDALVHAFEAYVSTANSPLFDLHALDAIRLVNTYLPLAIEHPDNIEYRTQMSLASLQAGLAFSNASLGAVHAMAHSLGGLLDLPHGECNAILLDRVVAFNFPSARARYEKIAEAMDVSPQNLSTDEIQKKLIDAIVTLRQGAGISTCLRDHGAKLSDIPQLAEKALSDPCMVTNPRRPNKRDIELIYEEAL